MEGMPGMGSMSPPITTTSSNHTHHALSTLMHMTFFWSTDAEILFSGWPGTRKGMYALALIYIFALSILVEWLSHCRFLGKEGSSGDVASGVVRTVMYGVRIGLAYLVMLAVMSFNGGVFLVALGGHALGFFVFGSRVFGKSQDCEKASDLPPLSC
ncbi:Copper transporter like [Actinidia chinensis var. chinensis]|uniref:Copper transport protein n=1 Tax=Actinidia chinensis var. chinensis TaxID=1590841 RepID=A0A2R6P665_ACTCC|nr:Copper transporter like [Actinidia chinensis var. chinensis]